MVALSIPPAVWMFLTAAFLLFGLMCICIGAPGKTLLKTSLIWFCASWLVCVIDLATIAVYVHYNIEVPAVLAITWMTTVQVFIIALTYFFYAAAEKEHGLYSLNFLHG